MQHGNKNSAGSDYWNKTVLALLTLLLMTAWASVEASDSTVFIAVEDDSDVDVDGNDHRPVLRCQGNTVRCSWLVTRNTTSCSEKKKSRSCVTMTVNMLRARRDVWKRQKDEKTAKQTGKNKYKKKSNKIKGYVKCRWQWTSTIWNPVFISCVLYVRFHFL